MAGFTLIPVIDLMGGIVVHARAGERARYEPLRSRLADGSEAVDIVVSCSRGRHGPRVNEVLAVEDLAGGADSTQFTVTELFHRRSYEGPLEWTGNVPVRSLRAFDDAGLNVHELLQGDTPRPAAPR